MNADISKGTFTAEDLIFVHSFGWFAFPVEITSSPSLTELKAAALRMVVAMDSARADVGDWEVGFNRTVAGNITSLVDVRFWAETDTPCLKGRVKNIARGTTDPEIDSVTWIDFNNNMAPLALVENFTTRWRHLH